MSSVLWPLRSTMGSAGETGCKSESKLWVGGTAGCLNLDCRYLLINLKIFFGKAFATDKMLVKMRLISRREK